MAARAAQAERAPRIDDLELSLWHRHDAGHGAHRIGVAAFGEYHPRVRNDTPEHRAQNRRIEISILRYE